MPKVVDAVERRTLVADAVFRIAARDGLHAASLREVAIEAGLNLGSVRHYFADQADLMRFAMRTMIDRVTARLRERAEALEDPAGLDPDERLARVEALLGELLPLDDRRHTEVVVFLEFSSAARIDPRLTDLAAESAAGTRALVSRVVRAVLERTGSARDADVETDRLVALLDGLSLVGTRAAAPLSADRCRAALRVHLLDLQAAAQAAVSSSSGRR